MSLPIIGITCGDTNGVGPEIIIDSLSNKEVLDILTPVIFGPTAVFKEVRKQLEKNAFQYQAVQDINNLKPGKIYFYNCNDNQNVSFGEPTQESGQNAKDALLAAGAFLKKKEIDALVTAPIDKSNIQGDGFQYPGHTEFLNALDPSNTGLMLMMHKNLRIAMYSGHIPLSEASASLNKEDLTRKILALSKVMQQDFAVRKPKIAVLGINPHAGDNGLLGKEDQEIILPVIKELKEKGNTVFGPFPADGFFGNNMQKDFDCVLAMYHDQGLIPFKSISFGEGTNFTSGLDFIRTSPDHGTAFDIAGKGQASNTSFNQALFNALSILRTRGLHIEASENILKSQPERRSKKAAVNR